MKNLYQTPKLICLTVLGSFFFLCAFGCMNKREEIVHNYPSGEISRRFTEINGKKEGLMTEYYKDGKLKSERRFEHDIQQGKSVLYYPSGKTKKVQYYEEGKLQGGDTLFYENGKPQFLRNFNKGVLDGYIRKWGVNDSLIYEAKYANDDLIEVQGESVHPDSLIKE